MLPLRINRPSLTSPLGLLYRDPQRAFENSFERIFNEPLASFEGTELMTGRWMPSVDVRENHDEIIVEADLPGVEKKDVKVSVEEDRLVITGERQLASEQKDENYHRVERAYGSFTRSFSLPHAADATKINAIHKNGVLTVHIPKRNGGKARGVEVKIA
jgi:HSP20 family protein